MKNIDSFIITKINEYRTPGSKNKTVSMKDLDGKDAEKNATDGKMGVNEPIDNSAVPKVDEYNKETVSKNQKRLRMKFDAEDDFFIIGRAGWGKTSIIHQLAKKYGYEVCTLYLDKMEAVELGGRPIVKGEKEVRLLPVFANTLNENPDKKYLLFFDEMNQATPDVMNALMPIILEHEIAGKKFDNFFCGAAGNYDDENDAVSELSVPLASRLKPLIDWETHTEDAWHDAFAYLHSQWDDKISKKLVDAFEDACVNFCFDNPREVEQKIFKKYIWGRIQAKSNYDSEDWLDHLKRMAVEKLDRSQEAKIEKLAELIYKTVAAGGKESNDNDRKQGTRKDKEMIPDNIKEAIKFGMQHGFIMDGDRKYGISRENIMSIEETEVNAEMMERLINKFEAEGIKFKFEKDEEWKKAGYEDPNAD